MASTKDIQRRIKSIGNTRKITKAMEMVAAAKMRRAIEAVLRTRSYANLSWATILNLSRAAQANLELHPLLSKRKRIRQVALVLITSNRGLCGGFNTAIINKAHQSIKKHAGQSDHQVGHEFLVVGKKGKAVYKNYGYNIVAEFDKQDIVNEAREAVPIAKMVIEEYLNGHYDKIMVAYTDFVSPAKQLPRVKQLLPVEIEAEEEFLGIVGQDTRLGIDRDFIAQKEKKYLADDKYSYDYVFEPNAWEVLNEMVPRLIEVQLLQALLESNASEHSARMNAMHQATEAASDIVSELTLFYNKARQAMITAEIAEISAGANALAE